MNHVTMSMGIPISIDVRDPDDFSDAIGEAFALLDEADLRFSTYRDDSEIAAINRGLLTPADYSDEMREVLRIGASFQLSSGGAFSLRIPGNQLDANGVVKGWAVERASAVLRARGARNFCINAGGDVVTSGGASPDATWHVAIRAPWSPAEMLTVFAVSDAAVATSGAYERGDHILDGRTGLVARELTSVSVIASSLTVADVLATTVFAMGPDGVRWAAANYRCSVFAVTPNRQILTAGDLPPEVEL